MVKVRRLLLDFEHMIDKEIFDKFGNVIEGFWTRNGVENG